MPCSPAWSAPVCFLIIQLQIPAQEEGGEATALLGTNLGEHGPALHFLPGV